MEDTKSLLIMVLQKVFQDRPQLVDDTFQLIYNYNNGRKEKLEYEKTLKTICDLMNDELPSQILVYLLTMVDMPSEGGYLLPIMEKMQKTHNCLQESVRPHLLKYLQTKKPIIVNPSEEEIQSVIVTENDNNINKDCIINTPKDNVVEISKEEVITTNFKCEKNIPVEINIPEDADFLKPTPRKCKNKRRIGKSNFEDESSIENPKTLLDICALYVVENEKQLKYMYKRTQSRAWRMINRNLLSGTPLQQCYTVIKDLNKKCKWLRMIENDEITSDVLMEEYGNSEVFLKSRHVFQELEEDPLESSSELLEYIENLEKKSLLKM